MGNGTATRSRNASATAIATPNESSWTDVQMVEPWAVEFTIRGTRPYLFNRYDTTPADRLKGQQEDDSPGRLVTLDPDGHLACNKLQVWNAVVSAGKYRPNPRSARGSFSTVLKEALEIETLGDSPDVLTFIAEDGKPYDKWEWEDSRRVKKAGAFAGYVTRTRPGLQPGWRIKGRAVILQPEYVTVPQLHECFAMAGRFGGIGDGRTGGIGYGRFLVERFEAVEIS